MSASASETGGDRPPGGTAAALLHRVRSIGVVRAVIAITVLALLARLVLLGARTAHWDEARVAYWILHTIETGDFAYRRIIHGPVVQHVNHVLVPLLGANDFVIRLPVAVVGGLLPLTALLFREHLEDAETVALALFLGANAVLLYYSRFMRSDVLVAAFMFAGFGFLVRFYDTRRFRYLYALGAAVALGFGSKENAAVYLLTWGGATALLADQALYRARAYDSGTDLLRATWLADAWGWLRAVPGRLAAWTRDETAGVGPWLRRLGSALRDPETRAGRVGRWLGHPVGAVVVFLALTVVIYAPRGAGAAGLHYPPVPADQGAVGLYEALGQPTLLPDLVVDTLRDTADQFGEWFAQSSDPGCQKDNVIDGWLCFLGRFLEVMRDHTLVLGVFAVLGFLYERYARARSRNLVMFAAMAGFVSILGYPLGTDVFGAWLVVHAVVPLAIPASVGVARLYRWGVEAVEAGDGVGAAVAAVVLLLLAGQVALVAAGSVYTNDTAESNNLVQYAQPADDLDPVVDAVERAAAEEREGADVVLYYGANGSDYDERQAIVSTSGGWSTNQLLTRPPCADWFNTLPLPWYFRTAGANVSCDDRPSLVVNRAQVHAPGVIVAMESDPTVPADRLAAAGYERRTYGMRTYGYQVQFYVHERVGWAASASSNP